MNKGLLLLFLLFSMTLSGFAQSLELSNAQGIIPPHAIIVQEGSPDSAQLITYMNVKNISNRAIDVICKKSQLSMLDSTEVFMCWAGGCYTPDTHISLSAQYIEPGQTITDFAGHYTQTAFQHFKSGESVVRWVFFDMVNVNDSMSVTIKYTSYPLGVEERNEPQTLLSGAYPNPAGASASFNYVIPSGSTGEIVVRNLLGATVLSEQLSTGNGKITINTTRLSDGIYFYSLKADGKVVQTKKLIVRH